MEKFCSAKTPKCPTFHTHLTHLNYYFSTFQSKDHCQVVPSITCPKCGGNACYADKHCCHPQCLGGCYGPERSQCNVCRGVVVNNPGEGQICSKCIIT